MLRKGKKPGQRMPHNYKRHWKWGRLRPHPLRTVYADHFLEVLFGKYANKKMWFFHKKTGRLLLRGHILLTKRQRPVNNLLVH